MGDDFLSARSREVLTLLSSFVDTTPLHSCSVANMAWDPLASVGRMLTIWALARGADCTNVHLARLVEGVQKADLDVHDASLASGRVPGTDKRRCSFTRSSIDVQDSPWFELLSSRIWAGVFRKDQFDSRATACAAIRGAVIKLFPDTMISREIGPDREEETDQTAILERGMDELASVVEEMGDTLDVQDVEDLR